MKNLSVSVTIVTRNRAPELRKAIQSVLAQSYGADEILVIDNASDDDTVGMLKREFAGVRLTRLDHNTGCQPARNIAMAKCRGDIIFNLDDDGTLHTDAIKYTVACFEKHPEVGLVTASVRVPDNKVNIYPNSHHDNTWHYTSCFLGCASALRRQVLDDAGFFPEYFRGHSESDLALRIINSGWEMMYYPKVIMYHHVSDIERNRNTETYYQIRHQLETSARLQPAGIALTQISWRILQGFFWSLKNKIFKGYCKGVWAFIGSLPRILRQRGPISKAASRKHHYLKHHKVKDLDNLPDFTRYGLRQMIASRFDKSTARK